MGVILFTPNLPSLFHLTALTSKQWLAVIILSLFSILQGELFKLGMGFIKARHQDQELESIADQHIILT